VLRTVPLSADISQNLHCYDFLPDAAALTEHGKKAAIENGLIRPGTLSEESFLKYDKIYKNGEFQGPKKWHLF